MNHTRTWQFNVNQSIAFTTGNRLLFALKQSLVSFPINPWIVVQSGTASSTANSDLWVSYLSLTWSTGNHSWIVLQNTVTGLYMLWDLNSATDEFITVKVSYSPFTGGSTSTAPIATNSLTILNQAAWGFTSAATLSTSTLYAMHSTDGYATKTVIWRDGSNVYNHFWSFDWMDSFIPELTKPYAIRLLGSGSTSVVTVVNFLETFNVRVWDNINSQWLICQPTLEGYGTKNLSENIYWFNEISEELQLQKIGLISRTVGARGKLGSITDTYIIPNGITTTGSTIDSGLWLVLGNLIIPWNGSTPSIP